LTLRLVIAYNFLRALTQRGVFYPPNLPRQIARISDASAVASEDWSMLEMYAIFRSGGRQYRAEVGATIDVERLPQDVDAQIEIDDVLLVSDGEKTLIGQPTVKGASVKATVVKQFRGKKVIVFKYRQRTNYRRRYGHRQYYTRLRIDDISVG